jgi:hypothetical protein
VQGRHGAIMEGGPMGFCGLGLGFKAGISGLWFAYYSVPESGRDIAIMCRTMVEHCSHGKIYRMRCPNGEFWTLALQ